MRYMDSSNVMVPVAACSGVAATLDVSQPTSKLPLTLSTSDATLRKNHNGLKQAYLLPGIVPQAHVLPDNIYSIKPWELLTKDSLSTTKVKDNNYYSDIKLKHLDNNNESCRLKENSLPFFGDENGDSLLQCNRSCLNALSQSYFPCRLPDAPMNGAEKLAMTGSSNPHSDQLNWLSEVASAAAKGTLNKLTSSPNRNDQPVSLPPTLHTVGGDMPSQLLLSNTSSVFSPPIVVARPAGGGATSMRMFTPPFQIERTTRHVQHASIPGSGTMYYSQASRTAPISNFFQATPQSNVTNSSASSTDPSRSYLQVNSYSSLSTTHNVGSSPQLSCSPSYLQSTSSPTNPALPSSHGRMFQQGRSILISRSPEGMIVQQQQQLPHDQCHVQIQLSPTLPPQQQAQQQQDETNRRKSFTSNDSVLGSSSCSPVCPETASHGTDFITVGQQQRSSPSHVSYRLPTGKEGSLKHRILRPPSINILDPPHSVVADAPLSAPPIRTHREPSPKQARSVPSSGYRSFSSSASSITEGGRVVPSPGGTYPNNHCSSFSSSGCPSPAAPNSPGTAAAQLKYPQSFMKGSIIQLANNKLKQVEDMTTEDFVECGLLSSTLKIDSSTVVNIEKTPFTGAAKLGFHVGQDNIQITVEAPLEHPFFVYKQGWSSCSPERSAQRYGLACHKLKVGDVCISLTDKPRSATSAGQQKVTADVPVPIVNVSDSNQNVFNDRTVKSKEGGPLDVLHLPPNVGSPSEKLTNNTTQSDNRSCTGKRKRRWSAPDNLSQNEDGIPSS